MRKKKIMPIWYDEYGVMTLRAENALWIREKLDRGEAVAVPLDLQNMTMFHISFVPLNKAIPMELNYTDGSSHGIQINIDRGSSYAIPYGSQINEYSYIQDKWELSQADAEALLPFFNTVITGRDCFK